jgi:hypothetical protein
VFPLVLMVLSWLRWLVLLALVVRAGLGGWAWSQGAAWTPLDRRATLIAVILADLQLTLGVLLYAFFSPAVRMAMSDPGGAMKDSHLRWAFVEHPTMMVLALVALHVGSALVKRAASDGARHRIAPDRDVERAPRLRADAARAAPLILPSGVTPR